MAPEEIMELMINHEDNIKKNVRKILDNQDKTVEKISDQRKREAGGEILKILKKLSIDDASREELGEIETLLFDFPDNLLSKTTDDFKSIIARSCNTEHTSHFMSFFIEPPVTLKEALKEVENIALAYQTLGLGVKRAV